VELKLPKIVSNDLLNRGERSFQSGQFGLHWADGIEAVMVQSGLAFD
jgi:hypothetical protein